MVDKVTYVLVTHRNGNSGYRRVEFSPDFDMSALADLVEKDEDLKQVVVIEGDVLYSSRRTYAEDLDPEKLMQYMKNVGAVNDSGK